MSKNTLAKAGVATLCLFVSGCASLPDVSYTYYLRKSTVSVSVTRTVACNANGIGIVVIDSPQATAAYGPDFTKPPITVAIKKLDGTFGDSDTSFTFTETGVLDGVNQSTTGQGSAIVKSVIAFAGAVGAAGGSLTAADYTHDCKLIADAAGQNKALTLNYKFDVGDISGLNNTPIPVTPDSAFNALGLSDHLQAPMVSLKDAHDLAPVVPPPLKDIGDHVDVFVQVMKTATLEFANTNGSTGKATVMLPTTPYSLPIPVGQPFGTQKFILKLAASGAITQIDYAKSTGLGSAFDAGTAVLNAAAPASAADQAADLKAQADLIAQQQRLARCQANIATCT